MLGGRRMKPALVLGFVALLGGCSRTVTYTYEPSEHRAQDFDHRAEKECEKFGDHAVYAGHYWAELGRDGVNYICEPR